MAHLFSSICCGCWVTKFASLWTHGLYPARVFCPWNFPGKNTRVGCHFILQGIFLTQGLNLCLFSLLHWQGFFFTPVLPGKPCFIHTPTLEGSYFKMFLQMKNASMRQLSSTQKSHSPQGTLFFGFGTRTSNGTQAYLMEFINASHLKIEARKILKMIIF